MPGPIPSASSSYWWETVDVFGFSSVVTVSSVPSMGGTGGIRMPQGVKFDDSCYEIPELD